MRVKGRKSEAIDAYLESIRTSHDFRTSYVIVFVLAQQSAVSDPSGDRRMLLALEAADPYRPEARILLNKLFEP
ncbi:spermine synthase [Candidatus Scalindua japonica]|uniref:Spermine synthase n=1 Tax=Candidatus Scalindua japonica TaxID=1284222 RepID=A0A286TVU0_9BACT|nr:spermine synthase [Candidatus Scalindua japonica]